MCYIMYTILSPISSAFGKFRTWLGGREVIEIVYVLKTKIGN